MAVREFISYLSNANQDMIHFQRINKINDQLKMVDDLNHIWEILTLDCY